MNQKYKSFILFFFFFFFNDTATTEIYTLSLHDALPILPVSIAWAQRETKSSTRTYCSTRRISASVGAAGVVMPASPPRAQGSGGPGQGPAHSWGSPGPGRAGRRSDRKSTRLNSSHGSISYAVFCLKKKKKWNANSAVRGLQLW